MNKRWNVIGVLLVLLLFSYCGKRETKQINVQTSDILANVDSLMWQRPDSALACLLPYFDTCCRDVSRNVSETENDGISGDVSGNVSTDFNRHYAHLLLAELLYKNDYAQTNRAELRQAVEYFDSLLMADTRGVSPQRHGRRDALHASAQNVSANTAAFLDARAHYINGVGYYEHDSIVEACEEYLKALEMMENCFAENELVGTKAKFMTYTYNRLGDIFEEQLLAEPAIFCYKQALFYCRQNPTSIYGISVLLYSIGIQYDITNQKDSANFYYEKSLSNMPDNENIHYRDIITAKTVLAYNTGFCVDSVIKVLKQVISISADDYERTRRFLILGNILFENKMYDSSRLYLETAFEQIEDIQSRILAAENLCNIYQEEGDSIKVQKYASFLAGFTMSEIEKKKDVSKINELFKKHLTQKQEKRVGEEREKAIKGVMRIIVPIAVVVTLLIVVLEKLRSKKLLKMQHEEAVRRLGESEQQHEEELRQRQAEAEKILEDKEKHHQLEIEAKEAQVKMELEERDKRHAEAIEAERQTHRMEQAAMSGRLKQSNQEVRELKEQIKQQDDLAAKTETVSSFNEEPICRLIMERVHDGQFKSKIDCEIYKSYALDKQQLLDLRMAVDRHFSQFTLRLRKAYPKFTSIDIDYCCLYLLNLTHADVSALMQRAYNTVVERDSKIQKVIGREKPLPVTLMDIAQNPSSI